MGSSHREGVAASSARGRVQARPGPGDGQEDEEDEELLQNGCAKDVDAPALTSSSVDGGGPHQQQGPIIWWERFLPVKTLKVLLVESDDSTRHVVTALLRNCSYEVITAANGLEAWKILEDLTTQIDIVLTEVSMPSLSGVGLLSKIMSNKTCKNIPVIMISSNDSMGTVFKCLSKGAVDFLVKPIRKNELKNLWQHVWRRYHSSSGSGSESGILTGVRNKSKSGDESDNNTGSNGDNDDARSIGPNGGDGSDCSGTQSSWTKHAVEAESPGPSSPLDQLGDPPDSTCAQVIHPKPEIHGNEWLPMRSTTDCHKPKERHDDLMGKDLEIGVPCNNSEYQPYSADRAADDPKNFNARKMPEMTISNDAAQGPDGSDAFEDPTVQAADLIGSIAKTTKSQRAVLDPNGFCKPPEGKDKKYTSLIDAPSLELSLKRLRSSNEAGTNVQDERNVLRRSDQSAFTRYHTSAASTQGQTGCVGSCSPLNNSSDAVKTDSTQNMKSDSNALIKQGSNGSSNNNDMGSTTNNVFSKPVTSREKVLSPSAVKNSQQTSAIQPAQFRASPGPAVVPEITNDASAETATGQHQVQVQHHHHHYHHHHHIHCMQQQQQQQQSSVDHKLSGKSAALAGAAQCGSSNGIRAEGQAANYSVNGSNSGSNPGSNGQNRSTTSANAGGMNTESAMVVDKSAGGVSGSGSGCGSGVFQNRLALRELALTKFRQKRKQRNFGKKVRYQSRKKLAEQRPRVRGQFVRQPLPDQTIQDGERKTQS